MRKRVVRKIDYSLKLHSQISYIKALFVYNYANQNKHVKKYHRETLFIVNKVYGYNLTDHLNTHKILALATPINTLKINIEKK